MDIATLGLRLDAGQAIRDADQLTASLKRVSQGADQSVPYVRGLGQASTDAGRRMALLEVEAVKMDAAMRTGAASTGLHGLQLGRLNAELGTFIGRATGANTAATRLAAQVGGAVGGYGAMIGVMVGISALLWIWDKMADGLG